MQVVIDIDENLYTRLFDMSANTMRDMRAACSTIRNGTPLPKGHELEQEPKTGYWIDNHHGAISCSNCHTYFCKWYVKGDAYLYMRRCPHCGAKMQTESEE